MDGKSNELNSLTMNLVLRAKKGDRDAFDALYKLYEHRLKGAVKTGLSEKLKIRIDTEDLIQSVWKDVWAERAFIEYRGPDSFVRWLSLRLIRKIQDKNRYFAAQKRDMDRELRPRNNGSAGLPISQKQAADQTPSREAIAEEELGTLMRMLEHLKDQHRQALIYRIRDNMTFEEIGKRLKKSSGAARQLFNRALSNLVTVMAKEKNKQPK